MFYLRFLISYIIVVVLSLLIYLLSLDLIVYNYDFLETSYFRWLFYLLPIITSFLLTVAVVFMKKQYNILSAVLLTLAVVYFVLSFFMITGIYCESIKNLNTYHIIVTIGISLLIIFLFIKNILPTITLYNRILIILSAITVLLDLYFFLFGYYLIY